MTTLKDADTRDEQIDDDADVIAETAAPDIEPETAEEQSDTTDDDAETDAAEAEDVPDDPPERRRIAWSRVLAFGVLPGLALLLALTAGYLRWLGGSAHDPAALRAETIRIASDDAVALLSYQPESADKQLGAARERLTGDFKDAYTALTRQMIIPGAKEKHISAVVKVSAAASVSATDRHAVVLVFANQTVTVGEGVPTDTAPVVRVVLDKVNGQWLVSHFDPV
jgi:Mce-associated membrane protein